MKVTKTYSIEIRSMIFSLSEAEFAQLREVVNSVSPELKFEKLEPPDPYAELKKAKADGKPIQLRSPGSSEWRDQNSESCLWLFPLENYRIKPEEPKTDESHWPKAAPKYPDGHPLNDLTKDGWIPWGGGERPVGPHVRVDAKLYSGDLISDEEADCLNWKHYGGERDSKGNIIAYRIVKP